MARKESQIQWKVQKFLLYQEQEIRGSTYIHATGDLVEWGEIKYTDHIWYICSKYFTAIL
jgi:hypothetical protein